MTPDYELLPFVDICLVLQSIFLNFLWILLFWAWVVAAQKYPRQTFMGGVPGKFHWIIAGVVWALTFGVAVLEFDPIYWFLGFAIANGAMLSILNPACAVCFSMSMLLLRPWEIMQDNALILEIPRFSMFFTIGWAIFYLFVIDRFSLRLNKAALAVLAYAAWVFLSTFVTPNSTEARMGFNETMVRAVTLYVLLFHLLRDRFSVWAIKTSLVTMFTCVGAISAIFYFEGYRDGGRIIAFGMFKNTNDIAAVMTCLLPLAMAPFFRKQVRALDRVVALIPIGVALLVLALAQSRGAVFSLAACGAVYMLLKIKRKTLAIAMVSGVMLVGVGATTLFKRGEGDLEGSSASRKSFWISGMRMALYNPVFGVGFNQFPDNFESYASEIVGEYGKRTAHSSWILALAEGGPVGLILFALVYFWGSIGPGLRIYDIEPEWLYSAVAYGVAISFLSHTYMLFPYILAALVTAAARAIQVQKVQERMGIA